MKQKCAFTGKNKFEDYEEALDRLIFLKNFHPRDSITGKRIKHRQKRPTLKRVYKCNYCNGYHLTSWEYNYNWKEESFRIKLKITKPFMQLWRALLPPAPADARTRRKKRRDAWFARLAQFQKNRRYPAKKQTSSSFG